MAATPGSGAFRRGKLGYALWLERAGGFQNDPVNIGHCSDGIVRRLVMMLRVVAGGNGICEVKFVAVETPVANEFFGEVLVILLNFGNCGTKSGQISSDAGRLSIFIQDQPVGMIPYHVR